MNSSNAPPSSNFSKSFLILTSFLFSSLISFSVPCAPLTSFETLSCGLAHKSFRFPYYPLPTVSTQHPKTPPSSFPFSLDSLLTSSSVPLPSFFPLYNPIPSADRVSKTQIQLYHFHNFLWFLMVSRINSKFLSLVDKTLHPVSPTYLSSPISPNSPRSTLYVCYSKHPVIIIYFHVFMNICMTQYTFRLQQDIGLLEGTKKSSYGCQVMMG